MLQELADLGWGFKRIAAGYCRRTGEYVSHMTVRDRLGEFAKDRIHELVRSQRGAMADRLGPSQVE